MSSKSDRTAVFLTIDHCCKELQDASDPAARVWDSLVCSRAMPTILFLGGGGGEWGGGEAEVWIWSHL